MTEAIELLKRYPHWVAWRYEQRDGKRTKVPKNPLTGLNASSNDAATWAGFDDASSVNADGIGFMLAHNVVNLVGTDLDHCVQDKIVAEWAMKIVDRLNSYTEITPSETGLRTWILGDLPPTGRKKGNIEMYKDLRFLTVTGNHLVGTPTTIEDRNAEILAIHQDVFGKPELKPVAKKTPQAADTLADKDLILKAQNAKNGNKFNELWNGNVSGYPSKSEADLALCSLLAFWTAGDKQRIDALFRQSGLYREKWDREDYRQMTINRALLTTTEHYSPNGGTFRPESSKEKKSEPGSADYPDRPPTGAQPGSDNGQEPKREKKRVPTDDILRDRFLSDAGTDIIFGLGEFRRYQNGIWQTVPTMVVENEICQVIEAAKGENVKPSMRLLNSVSGLTKRRVFVEDKAFNSDPDYLVCANGTLHISEMKLMEHTKKLYATSGVDYDYNPQAKCPSWKTFCISLAQRTSPTIVDFLQEFAGYALTTDMRYETAVWLHGTPGAGRSTFLLGLETMLNKRAGVLGLAQIERSQFALSNLIGKTLLVAGEQPNVFLKSTNLLNSIISGDKISIDRKFLPEIEIYPRAKIAWAMNGLPRVSDPNSGIFRRIKVVEFPVIPPDRRDPGLKEGIKREGSGILNWALAGLARLNERGRFDVPQEVTEATQNFQADNDIPARFIEESCLTGPDYKTQGSLLYIEYKDWTIENGHKTQSSTRIANDWKRFGFEKKPSRGLSFWQGVGLKSQFSPKSRE